MLTKSHLCIIDSIRLIEEAITNYKESFYGHNSMPDGSIRHIFSYMTPQKKWVVYAFKTHWEASTLEELLKNVYNFGVGILNRHQSVEEFKVLLKKVKRKEKGCLWLIMA